MTLTASIQKHPGPRISLNPPWLTVDLGAPHSITGWPVVGPVLGTASSVTWLQVESADLPRSVDPDAFFLHRARSEGIPSEVGLLTAAEIARYATVKHDTGNGGAVTIVATAGLGNGESVFPSKLAKGGASHRVGTVNILAIAPYPLTPHAQLEAISIVAEARTAAILDLRRSTTDGRPVTGTGTDCIIIAAPLEGETHMHCGLHTDLGRALGEAAFEAAREACARSLKETA